MLRKNNIPQKVWVGHGTEIGGEFRKFDIPFRKRYKSQFTSEIFEIVKTATYKPPTYNLKGEQVDEMLGKFYEQELSKCII